MDSSFSCPYLHSLAREMAQVGIHGLHSSDAQQDPAQNLPAVLVLIAPEQDQVMGGECLEDGCSTEIPMSCHSCDIDAHGIPIITSHKHDRSYMSTSWALACLNRIWEKVALKGLCCGAGLRLQLTG